MCSRCDPAPYCYWCGDRTARRLPGLADAALDGPVYCTLVCAAYSALFSDAARGLSWCAECQQWHTKTKGCQAFEPARFCVKEVS
jgi:hypothetical protein